MNVVRLSALVCVHNQDAELSACLRRLAFCDEVVVVADRCTDRSHEIARRNGAVVIDGIFPLESQRKAAGLTACSGQWILEIEPDELVDTALAWEIRAALQRGPEGDCFELPIDNYVGGTLVRHGWAGALSASSAVRLYQRGVKSWKPLRLHAGAARPDAEPGALKGAIRRTVGRDIGAVVDLLNRQTLLRAEDLADAEAPGLLVGGMAAGLGQFFRSYVSRQGWREGRFGLFVALMSGLYPVLSHMRAREILEARRAAVAQASRPEPLREVIGMAAR